MKWKEDPLISPLLEVKMFLHAIHLDSWCEGAALGIIDTTSKVAKPRRIHDSPLMGQKRCTIARPFVLLIRLAIYGAIVMAVSSEAEEDEVIDHKGFAALSEMIILVHIRIEIEAWRSHFFVLSLNCGESESRSMVRQWMTGINRSRPNHLPP